MAKTQEYLPAGELSLFLEQVAMILHAGIPLYDGMETLAVSYKDSRYGDRFVELYMGVLKTGALADALEKSGLFPPYLVAMTRIGETTGKLDEVLSALSKYYAFEADLKETVRSAVIYPTVLVSMLAVVVAILVISVLPIFSRVFESLGAASGAGETGIMAFGVGLGKGALVLVGLFLMTALLIGLLLKSDRRNGTMAFLRKLSPGLQKAQFRISAGRFANVMSIMLVSGYNLETAMEVSPTVINDAEYAKRIRTCANAMKAGKPFPAAAEQAGLFSDMHLKMLTFGAAAGQMDAVMKKLSEVYAKEASSAIQSLVSLIEPSLVAVLSVVIGGILLSVTLPLISILSALA